MPTRAQSFSVASFSGIFLAALIPACLTDPEEPRFPESESESEPPKARKLSDAPAAASKACAGAPRAAADGLVDDFEDGDGRLSAFGGRTGYWWIAKADHALVTAPSGAFTSSDGGANGSKKAARFAGKTDSKDEWGAAVGVSFLESGAFYDASKYAGVAFRIKASRPNLAVRVKLPDVSTHPDGGVCRTGCWNSFGKDLVVGTEWQDVVVTWGELAQQSNWGEPRPPGVTPSKIKSIEWAVDKGVEFDLVVDDVHFVECG